MRIKDENGNVVNKQFGKVLWDDQLQKNFKNQDTPSINELLLKDQLEFFNVPKGWKPVTLTLKNFPGEGLVPGKSTLYDGNEVQWMVLGPAENAIEVFVAHDQMGDYLKMAIKPNLQFNMSLAQYHDGNLVLFYKNENA